MEYRTCIKDELGCVIFWCDELSEIEIEELLINHPEWSRSCVAI